MPWQMLLVTVGSSCICQEMRPRSPSSLPSCPPIARPRSTAAGPRSRVHIHVLPGGGDAALFRAAPAFSAALWHNAGYVPKRLGFCYCIEPKKEKHYVRSLSCSGKKIDGDEQPLPPLSGAKKREPDSWKDGCQQSEACAIRDATCEDCYAEINMTSSDLQSIKTKQKMEKSLELSGEKKGSEKVPRTLSKDDKKVMLKLELLSGVRTTSSVAEQEVHSGFVGVEPAGASWAAGFQTFSQP